MKPLKIYTTEELKQIVPAAFTEKPAEHVSKRYAYVNTAQVLDYIMQNTSFVPVGASSATTRTRPKEYTEHVVHLQNANTLKDVYDVNDIKARISIYNSHDAKSAIRILVGLFRCICANQAFAPMKGYSNTLRIVHIGDPANIQRSVSAAITVGIQQAKKLLTLIETWKAIELDAPERRNFALNAVLIKQPKLLEKSPVDANFIACMLLKARRSEDTANDLWTVFNRVQENLIRGVHTRGFSTVRGLNSGIELNQNLWALAEHFAVNVQQAA